MFQCVLYFVTFTRLGNYILFALLLKSYCSLKNILCEVDKFCVYEVIYKLLHY